MPKTKDPLNPHNLQVGDYARNIESGWLGKIVEISEPQEVKIDATRSYFERTAKMIGVDTLVATVAGCSWDDALTEDDVQWHDPKDLTPAK